MKIVNVVLTGGIGSRLWPLSRKEKPKQYINLVEGKSLFQQTVLRNQIIANELMVVGNKDNSHLSKEHLAEINISQYTEIIEVEPRNTAAAIAFAAFAVNPNDILIVTPSDHLIEDLELYNQCLEQAVSLAKRDAIVTFGLKPTKPETGYGYIQICNNKVLGFREKPNEETARKFIKSGDFYWNSGMFCFKASIFLNELEKYEVEVYQKSKETFLKSKNGKLPLEESKAIPSISVDYAVMERTKRLQAVIGTFRWSDMGSFESIYEYLLSKGYSTDKNGNMVIGTDIYTEFLGLKRCIFVYTPDAILILKKEKSQDVKNAYERWDSSRNNDLINL